MSEEDYEVSEETEEESEEKSSKKKSKTLKDIQDEKQKDFKKKIEKIQESLNSCIFLKELDKSKHPLEHSKVDPPCYNCGRPSIWDIKLQNKEGFNLNKIENLCQKEIEKKLQLCLNPNVPYLIAPCLIMKEKQKCVAFPDQDKKDAPKLTKTDPIHIKWEDNCRNLEQIEWITNEDDTKRCQICGLKATHKYVITPKQNFKIKEIFVCERHAKIVWACKSDFVPFILAPCVMLEDSKDCIYFRE